MIGTIVQQTFNALTIGSIYALIALGYTMVYGVLRMINFAHGEMFMLGAYAAYVLLALMVPNIGAAPALALTAAFFGAILVIGIFGVGIERVAYKPLRKSTRLAPMLSSLGVSLFLVTGVQIADWLESLFRKGACDGFMVSPAHLPAGFDGFVQHVVPELQRRGLFRTAYRGRTLRENLAD